MKRKTGVSSRDVAREAGVSQATVSYVLNNAPNVKIRPETREAVLQAVKKLNYHPNEIARGMKLNKSMSIGVVTDTNVTNFYFMKTLEGIKDGLKQNNYSITLLFNKAEEVTDTEYIRYYSSNRLDGIIFAFASLDDRTIEYMNEKGIPFVIVDTLRNGKDVHEVCTDHLEHITRVIQYFSDKGCKSIGYVGPGGSCSSNRRAEAFRRAMKEKGLELKDERIKQSIFDDAKILEAFKEVLTLDDRPEALLAGSPRFGLMAVKCAMMLGIRVPEELKVVAFGSSNFYEITHPSLSAVEVPLYDMGYRASSMLLDIIGGVDVGNTVVLTAEMVLRDSS